MARDYIPRANEKFFIFQDNIAKGVAANASSWDIPSDESNDLAQSSAKCKTLFNIIRQKGNRTQTQVKEFQQFREEYEKDLRYFVNRYLRNNKKIDIGQKTGLAIPTRGKRRRSRASITDKVWLMVIEEKGNRILFKSRVPESEGKARLQAEADGVEIRYSIGEKIENPDLMPFSHISRKASFRITFDYIHRGKKIYAFARWKNLVNDSLSGPWNELQEGLIL